MLPTLDTELIHNSTCGEREREREDVQHRADHPAVARYLFQRLTSRLTT